MAAKEQNVTISIKVKLYPDQKTIEEFKKLTTTYSEAATWLSDLMFNDFSSPEMITARKTLHDRYYYDIRQKKDMKSQLAESLIKSVSAKYKAIGTTFKKQYYTYTDADGNTAKYRKDLNWLQHPVVYKRPQADLVRGRDWSFVNDDNGGLILSIATLTGRTKVRFVVKGFDDVINDSDMPGLNIEDPKWKFGEAKLLSSGGKWFVHISATAKLPVTDSEDISNIVGLDRGLVNIVTAADQSGFTARYSGDDARKIRARYNKTRTSLQKKGTRGAKRVLKRLSGRENGYMNDVNHCLTKALCENYPEDTLFVLEDLTGVSFEERNFHSKEQTNELRSWTFYDFGEKLKYKAALRGQQVIEVDAYKTSQRCPHCGRYDKAARHRDTHEYICPECGHVENDDEVGALNLMFLGAEYLKCGKKPSFTKMEPKSKKGKANANAAKKNAENTIAENAFVLI